MPAKKKVVEFECDLGDMSTHDWQETTPWLTTPTQQGESRTITCKQCGHGPVVQLRTTDPDNPAPTVAENLSLDDTDN